MSDFTPTCASGYHGIACDFPLDEHERPDWHQRVSTGYSAYWDDTTADWIEPTGEPRGETRWL